MTATCSKKTVALVVPNFFWCDWDDDSRWQFIPYNICIIAAMIRETWNVCIIDANHENLNEAELATRILEIRPDVVGITSLMDQYGPAGHHAAKIIKDVLPTTLIVFGGVYATMNTNDVLADPNIDFVVIGEGEYVFRELLLHLLGGGDLPQHGIAFRKNKEIKNKGHAERVTDFFSIPLPAYDLIDFPAYVRDFPKRRSVDMAPLIPYARVLTSRGCPYQCVFCQVEHISGRKFRGRPAEDVLNEIQWLRDTFGVRSLVFDDDNLFTKPSRASAIFQGMVDRGIAMPWVSIATAAFKINEVLLDDMRASGCEYIDIAVESGSERVLKEIIGKPLDLNHAKRIARAARERGIYVGANFVIGFPGETWQEILETIRFAEEIDVDYVKIFSAIPLPQTKLWKLCKEQNAFKNGYSDRKIRWNKGQIETDQFTSRDLTILRAYEWDRINFSNPEKARRTAQRMRVTEKELWKIRRRTLYQATHFGKED